MCGICGWYNKSKSIETEVIVKMNQIAKHRGPDDEGYALISDEGIENLLGKDSIRLSYPQISEIWERIAYTNIGMSIHEIINRERKLTEYSKFMKMP